ncbi:MAG: tetratricopeptide repeat protein [Gammaproteobacteria bacterium]|nr:tetratricopeptide repeat protein [Gammaproteobacteria bacterium]
MLKDTRNEPVSTTNARALDYYETALTQFQTYVGDPVETIELALQEDPGFVLGHAFRATMLLLMSERQYLPEIRKSIESAETSPKNANDRERGLTRAARQWLEGDWRGASVTWDKVLADHPRDALALQAGHLMDFYLGDAVNLRDRVARALPHWDESTPGYSYVLGMQAFGYEECNDYAKAEQTGRHALELDAKDGWAVHAVAHVLEMQTRFDEGIEFLKSRENDWAPDNGFAFHNWWHLALYYLERCDYGRALELYDTQVNPEPTGMSLQMLDASALLWRIHLRDVDTGNRWSTLADEWLKKVPQENGYYAFNDLHALMALLNARRDQEAQQLLQDMEVTAQSDVGINSMMSREVGLPAARAFAAFAHGKYAEVVDDLMHVRTRANRFGGSHAQRDVLNQTLIEAAIRSKQHGLAHNLVNERLAWKPHSPLAWTFKAKANHAADDVSGAKFAEGEANKLLCNHNYKAA